MRKQRVKALREFCIANPDIAGIVKITNQGYVVTMWRRVKQGYYAWNRKGRPGDLKTFLQAYTELDKRDRMRLIQDFFKKAISRRKK